MIRSLLLFLLLLAAGPATAQDSVRVRSGEHADFSRLVLYLPEPRAWRLGRTEDGYRLEFEGEATRFDLSEVFAFIPRTRLADLAPVPGDRAGLDLELACNCNANAFEYRPSILVIDVKDGPPPPDARFEQALHSGVPAPSTTVAARPTAGGLPDLAGLAAGRGVLPGLPDLFVGPAAAPAGSDDAPAAAAAPDVGAFRTALVSELSVALNQGVVREADGPTPQAPATPRGQDPAGPAPARNPAPLAETAGPTPPQRSGLSIATDDVIRTERGFSLSTAFDLGRLGVAPTPQGSGCRPAEDYAFLTDASDTSATDLLAQARAGLLQDMDIPDQAGVADMARAYLALGFGAEARQTLQAFGRDGPEVAFLTDLSAVIDKPGQVDAELGRRLGSEVSCDTPGAMWAVLASAGRNLPDPLNQAALLRAVSALPLHLRTHLVPPLSRALRQMELPDLAHSVRATLVRSGADTEPTMRLEQARAQVATEPALVAARPETTADPTNARPGAPTVAVDFPPAALSEPGLAAAAERIARMLAGRQPFDPAALDEAAALLHSSKGAPESAELLSVLAPAMALADRHRDALDMVGRLADSSHAEGYDLAGATAAILADLTARGSNGDFVLVLAERQAGLPEMLPEDLRRDVSGRLTDLQLTDLARRYAPPLTVDAAPALLTLYGAIALAEGQPMETLARIAAVEGPEADRLRTRALEVAGAQVQAAQMLQAAGDVADAADAAWLGQDWRLSALTLPPGPRRDLAARLSDLAASPETAASFGPGAGAEAGPLAGAVAGDARASGPSAQAAGLADDIPATPPLPAATLAGLPAPGAQESGSPAAAAAPNAAGGQPGVSTEPGAVGELASRRDLLADSALLRDAIEALRAGGPAEASAASQP